MKKHPFAAAMALLCLGAAASAQSFKTGYFLDNYAYSYRLNPAAAPSMYKQVIGIGVGNIEVSPTTNFGISSFLFPKDGELLLFLNEAVTSEEFMNGLEDFSKVNLDVTENILSLATIKEKSMFTFDLGLRSITNAGIPKEFFGILKDGTSKMHQEFSNLTLDSRNYLEAAIGFSRKIGPVSIGIRAKGLIGAGALRMSIDKVTADVNIATQSVVLQGSGSLAMSQKVIAIGTDASGNLDFNKITMAKPIGLGGFGFGIDFGATYTTPLPGLDIYASVLDLGMLKWNNNFVGKLNIDGKNVTKEDASDATALIKKMMDFKEDKTAEIPESGKLTPTILVGAKYHMPFYDKLSVGILGTFKKDMNEVRAGFNICPINLISLAGSAAFSSYGTDFGAALSFKFPGINLFVGMDALSFKVMPKYYIPTEKMRTTVNAGLSIAF